MHAAFTEFFAVMTHHSQYFVPGTPVCQCKAKAAVKSVKNMLKRTSHNNSDQYLALLEMHNTPRQDVNRNPTQVVFDHCIHSLLPVFLKPCTALDVRKRLTRRRQTKQCSHRHARPPSTLHANRPVYFQHPRGRGGLEAPLCTALIRVRTL